jgi:hypothetical protein
MVQIKKEKKYCRKCPNCDNNICYTTKYALIDGDSKNTKCTKCFGDLQRGLKNPMHKNHSKIKHKESYYKTYNQKHIKLDNEIIEMVFNSDLTYKEISNKLSVSVSKINYLLNKNNLKRGRNPSKNFKEHSKKLMYENIINKGLHKNGGVKTKEHYEKIFKSRYGYDYDVFLKNKNDYKKYYSEVRKLTNQNIKKYHHLFENLDMLGICGEEDKYQMDHVLSIKDGYLHNISPILISHPSNLRVIKWEDNIKKGSKSDIDLDSLIENANNFLTKNFTLL